MTPTASTAAIHISGLTKTFGSSKALDNVELVVERGQIHTLAGENGSGKSTLIKILAGYHEPDPGSWIEVAGSRLPEGSATAAHRFGCRFVHQDLGLVDTLSVADNLSLGTGYPTRLGTINGKAWRRRVRTALDRVGLDVAPSLLVSSMTAAQRTGVALARAMQEDQECPPRLLVLDEPTAALPDREVRDLHAMVATAANSGVGVLYVTHHLGEIFQIGDVVSVLRDGVFVVSSVPTSTLDHERLIQLIVGDTISTSSLPPPLASSTPEVLRVVDISRGALRRLSFTGRPGEVIGIAGVSGAGRENVLPTIYGALAADRGSVAVADEQVPAGSPRRSLAAGVSYLSPDRHLSGGVMKLSVRENVSLTDLRPFWRFPVLRRRSEKAATDHWIHRLGVRPITAAEQALETLSGGNQQKVLLAKWLRLNPRVLLLDEPTQGVDVGAKALLHSHIITAAREGACVVVSSSDNDELANLCTRVIVLAAGTFAEELSGPAMTGADITRASLVMAVAS